MMRTLFAAAVAVVFTLTVAGSADARRFNPNDPVKRCQKIGSTGAACEQYLRERDARRHR
jgi:hypothetical protein